MWEWKLVFKRELAGNSGECKLMRILPGQDGENYVIRSFIMSSFHKILLV
jgi:hypothetical protein